MVPLYPLRFRPILRAYLWGGRRLATSLGKQLPPADHWAESWEIADCGPDQSIAEFGPLAGTTLSRLVRDRGAELLGRHHPQSHFPLLLKFLDAAAALSVQVHPDDAHAAKLDPPGAGKTEAWVVLEAAPGSTIYAGLTPGVDRDALADAIRRGRCVDCLHSFEPAPGDCVLLPAGTVHALGAGLLVAEVQQPSDVTYRLFDWDRVGSDGRPRPLHVEAGLDAIDFSLGPIGPRRQCGKGDSPIFADAKIGTVPQPEANRLVDCNKFIIDRLTFDGRLPVGGDDRFHVVVVLEGAVKIEGDPAEKPLPRGGTALLPAGLGTVGMTARGKTVLLDVYLP